MTCPDCGHAGHAGRCFFLLDSGVGRYKTATCPCKRRDGDGRTVEDRAGGAGGGPALRGAASTAAMADAARGVEREGETVAKAMARIRGKLDAAFPLLTEYLERAHAARLGDLPMDLEKDEGDGGLGSGRWMDKP